MRIVGPRDKPLRWVWIQFEADDRDQSLQRLVARVQHFLDGEGQELRIGFAATPPLGWLGRLDQRFSWWLWRRRHDPATIVVRRP
ncbi:MAG: hypothetical protein ACRDNM_02915 [Gaiellaceae bacterium]